MVTMALLAVAMWLPWCCCYVALWVVARALLSGCHYDWFLKRCYRIEGGCQGIAGCMVLYLVTRYLWEVARALLGCCYGMWVGGC